MKLFFTKLFLSAEVTKLLFTTLQSIDGKENYKLIDIRKM